MAESETAALTTQQQPQPGVVVAEAGATTQNVQYVYQQPPQQQQVQYVYQQQPPPQQQQVNVHSANGYHQPAHRLPSNADDNDGEEEETAQVEVVKWENFKLPIPVNHATFMRKVWGCLVLQLLFTLGMIALFMYVPEIREWVTYNWWMQWVALFLTICVLCCLFPMRNKYPHNIVLLCVFTACMAYTVAAICAVYATYGMEDIVMQAFGITILVFCSLALFSCQTKCNLMPLGMIAFCMLSVMWWWGMWAIIFGWYNSSAWALMFIIIFCLLILFDVWRMCNMPVFEESAWILGAINLYLDVINLFLWILRCLAASQR